MRYNRLILYDCKHNQRTHCVTHDGLFDICIRKCLIHMQMRMYILYRVPLAYYIYTYIHISQESRLIRPALCMCVCVDHIKTNTKILMKLFVSSTAQWVNTLQL